MTQTKTGLLVVEGISKRFGPLVALDDFSVEFLPGEIHAVLGENGAGKSTLMNVLAGFLPPSEGRVRLDGSSLPLGRPHLCGEAGVAMVHQHFTLIPEFTVRENLALSRIDRLAAPLDLDRATRRSFEVAKELGWELDGDAKVRTLPVGVQQRIEILKCLSGEAKVLIFDEPTASLSGDEVEDLFRVLRQLKRAGKTVILIAHKLSEVMAIADRVTVLRRGRKVAESLVLETNPQELADWMVGEMPPQLEAPEVSELKDRLEVRGLQVKGDRGELAVAGVSLRAGGGILGIGGVDGNGQVELAEALAGVRAVAEGEILWNGEPLNHDNARIAYVPQDRQEDGLALAMSVRDNLLIGGLGHGSLARRGFFSMRAVQEWVAGLIERFGIKVENAQTHVSALSGGNQQKVVVSRNLDAVPDLLIAVSPTRGLDVKAARFVQDQILEANNRGACVILISSDLDELAALAGRIVYLSRGKLIDEAGSLALVGGSG